MVNITKSQQKQLDKAKAGLEIHTNKSFVTLSDGTETTKPCVNITDDCSDFNIEYIVNADDTLSLNVASEYIKKGLPTLITNTRELTKVCKHVAENY